MALQSYRDLEAWQVAMDLADAVYDLVKFLPSEERFELGSQFRRAAVSVPTNIAEGYGRCHRGDYVHHLSFAKGSVTELETLLSIALRRKYVTQDQLAKAWDLSQQAVRLLTKLIQSLN